MAKTVQFERKSKAGEIDPELKEFIDRAIVPVLVRQYLAEMDAQNELANAGRRVSQCDSSTATPALRGDARP